MTFLGYERPVEYGRQLIFDPTTANMVLNAQQNYINEVRNEYLRGLADLKEFNKEYGDFVTPILADQDWYNKNVTGKVRDFINNAYDNGIDLLRSPEGRLALAQLQNSIDIGSIAKLKSSAQNAEKFLESRRQLEAAGLYNLALAKYDGPDMTTYHTLNQGDEAGMGIWNKMSATPYRNMSEFTKAYFDNIAPFERSASKNGISYSISSITPQDLYNIAEAHYNDLVNTPQGQLMYKMYKDQLGSDEAAKKAFNDAVVAGNLDRLRYSDNYDERAYQMENLAIKRQNLALRQQIQRARQRGDNGGPGTKLQGLSLAQSWYDTAMAKAYGANGYTVDWDQMHKLYGDFSRDASKIFHDFGLKFISSEQQPTRKQIEDRLIKSWQQDGHSFSKSTLNTIVDKELEKWKKEHPVDLGKIRQAYKNQFTIAMDGKSVAEIIGTPLSDNEEVAKITDGAIDNLFGEDDVISGTSGYTKAHTSKDTKRIRDAIRKWGAENTTISSMKRGYGSLRKNTGSFEVLPEVKIVCTDKDGNVQFTGYGYYNIGLGSNSKKGGDYLGNYKQSGGAYDLGNMMGPNPTKFGIGDRQYKGDVYVGASRTPGLVYTDQYGPETNMFPDYNRWTEFGVWDTDLTSKRLHAGQSEKLGTYGNPYEQYNTYNLLEDLWGDLYEEE